MNICQVINGCHGNQANMCFFPYKYAYINTMSVLHHMKFSIQFNIVEDRNLNSSLLNNCCISHVIQSYILQEPRQHY